MTTHRRRSPGGRLAGEFLVAAFLLAAPGWVLLGEPIWALEPRLLPMVLGAALAYLAAAWSVVLIRHGPADRIWPRAVSIFLGVLALYLLAYLVYVPEPRVARRLLLVAFALSLFFVLLTAMLPRVARLAGMGVVAVVVVVLGALEMRGPVFPPTPHTTTRSIPAAYGPVRVTSYTDHVVPSFATGGGLSVLGDGYILAASDGDVYYLEWENDAGALRVVDLEVPVPLNREAFEADVPARVRTQWFRVAGVLAQRSGDGVQVTVSHHHWRRAEDCFVLRLSTLSTTEAELRGGVVVGGWRTLYDTRPCLPIKEIGHPFAGHQAGGQMAELDSARILLTVGDHEFDGWNSERALPQEPDADYGKLLVVHADGTAETMSLGHRNPQGLHIDAEGRIWSTEHGPQGGDELNRILAGANYGWPYATHGTDYGDVVWPLQEGGPGEYGSFRAPAFAWVPSIGVSALTSVRSDRFSGWRGDLLVGSLRARTLHRVRLDGNRVVVVESIPLGEGIRDIVEGADGRVVVLTNRPKILSLTPAQPASGGEAAFAQCVGCHSTDGRPGGIGPDLRGVYGRRIAAEAGFDYSDVLRSMRGHWTAEELDAFLAEPNAYAPGTSMVFVGVHDPARRADLIEYLKTVR